MFKKLSIGFLLFLMIISCVSLFVFFVNSIKTGDSNESAKKEERIKNKKLKSATSKSLHFGNVFWGRYIDDWSIKGYQPGMTAKKDSARDFSYPFSGLKSFDRDKYDSWFAGLECPLVKLTDEFRSSAAQDGNLSFICPQEYLTEAKKWYTGFTLANNHTDNGDMPGQYSVFEQTRKYLESDGVQYFGTHNNNIKTTDTCEVVSFPITVEYSEAFDSEPKEEVVTKEKKSIPIAMCGVHSVFELPEQKIFDEIKKYSDKFYTMVYPHMGAEYKPTPDEIKTSTYRKFIDFGADIVIGDHPHIVQTTEVYK
ncbi:MAG: CapA family protein, partial [Patescibacteria group bacterium]